MSAWITGLQLVTQAAAVLKVDVSLLPTTWTTIANQCALQAQADITGVMGYKGYSATQLDSWDLNATYALTQGLYRLGSQGGGFGDYDDKWFKQFDLCDKDGILTTAGVVISSGIIVPPDGTSGVGGVIGGTVGGYRGPSVAQALKRFDSLGGSCGCGSWY